MAVYQKAPPKFEMKCSAATAILEGPLSARLRRRSNMHVDMRSAVPALVRFGGKARRGMGDPSDSDGADRNVSNRTKFAGNPHKDFTLSFP
jgi:hypothetical protein